jgi:hypothetical protein
MRGAGGSSQELFMIFDCECAKPYFKTSSTLFMGCRNTFLVCAHQGLSMPRERAQAAPPAVDASASSSGGSHLGSGAVSSPRHMDSGGISSPHEQPPAAQPRRELRLHLWRWTLPLPPREPTPVQLVPAVRGKWAAAVSAAHMSNPRLLSLGESCGDIRRRLGDSSDTSTPCAATTFCCAN